MIQYPSIPSYGSSKVNFGENGIAFYKYDGSNLRWEWNPKKGWAKFGTRRTLFDHQTELYNQAIPIFLEQIGDAIVKNVKQEFGNNVQRITAFTEFFGKSSFAGSHNVDESKELKLFDVSVFKKGFLDPFLFNELFGSEKFAASVYYEGSFDTNLIDLVYNNRNGDLDEGIIFKTKDALCKIKTKQWLNKIKTLDNWEELV